SKDPAKRLDRAAARKMATTAIMDERVQRDIRNQMTSNLAAQAREAGTNKVLDQFNSAEAAALGIERGEAKAAQELMKQRSDELMAEGLSRPRADAETRRLVNGPQGQQYVQGQIARKRNEAAVFAGAQATAASIITPFSVVKANQATIDRVATEQNIQAETERIAASMAKSGAPVDMARARELAEQSVARGARLSATGAAISGRRNQNAAAVTSRSIGQEEARDLAIAGKINQRQIIEDERFLNAQKDEVARSSINEVVVDRKTGKRTVVQGTINTINLNKDNIAGLRQAAEKAYENGDLATFLAIGESLARNGGGRDEITKLQVDLFGRTNSQLISESAMQKAKERFGENFDLANFNNLFVAKVNRSARPDAYLPPDIAFDEMSPAAARQLDKRGWGHFLRWIGDRERRSRLPASDAAHVSKEDYNRNLNEAVAAINETLVSTRAREDLESNQFDRMREFAFDWNRATKRYTAFDGTEITNRTDLEAAIARAKAAGKKHPVKVRTDLVTGREVPIRDSAYDFLLETLRNEMP
ncbi:MAG TPA: hypothetical protein VI322_05165, partial [Candidatus Saccharimonadia bacterium]